MKWYPHDPSAALAGMIGLTVEERGAYYTLIDLCYARAPHSDVTDVLVIKALAVRPQVWRRLKARLMEKGKVRENGDGKLTANRVETTLITASKHGSLRGVFEGVSDTKSAETNGLEGTHARATTKTTSILESSLGKGSEAATAAWKPKVDDGGDGARYPPRAKSDNPLMPISEKKVGRS